MGSLATLNILPHMVKHYLITKPVDSTVLGSMSNIALSLLQTILTGFFPLVILVIFHANFYLC